MSKNIHAWEVSENDFPSSGTTEEKFKFFLYYAVLAPSGHNTQPWAFKLNENSIDVYADRTRALPVIDPEDKELIISCGAALTNLVIAIKYFGHDVSVSTYPLDGDNDFLARVTIKGSYEPNEEEKTLFKAIMKRHTNRLPFADEDVDGQMLQRFETIVSEDNCTKFVIIKDKAIRDEIIKLIELGDKTQCDNKSFCRELAAWVHPNRSNSKDGIPGYAFGMGDLISYAGPFFIGNMQWGEIQAGRDRNLVKGSPVLGVLESKTDNDEGWLCAGISLEKLLLKAASEGLAASYLNQPIEIPELRDRIKELLGLKGTPQLIMRMGYGKEVKATPRRDIDDVILKSS